jgi:microcystin-dependent protein
MGARSALPGFSLAAPTTPNQQEEIDMGTPFLSEIKICAFNFAPQGWAFCNGQLLPISQNQALFSLLGTTYGGNGQTTFALPNLQGRAPIHTGSGHTLGEVAGQYNHTLTQAEMPAHSHFFNATTGSSTTNTPSNAVGLSTSSGSSLYGPPQNLVTMDPGALASVGGGQPHSNQSPYLVLNFCIALQGVFPSQN